jgi:hypothetical protein
MLKFAKLIYSSLILKSGGKKGTEKSKPVACRAFVRLLATSDLHSFVGLCFETYCVIAANHVMLRRMVRGKNSVGRGKNSVGRDEASYGS